MTGADSSRRAIEHFASLREMGSEISTDPRREIFYNEARPSLAYHIEYVPHHRFTKLPIRQNYQIWHNQYSLIAGETWTDLLQHGQGSPKVLGNSEEAGRCSW